MQDVDGIILASPTYYDDVSTEMKALIDRAGLVAKANGDMLRRKVGASVIAVRRAGAIHAFDTMNHFFLIGRMVVPGSSYWNIGLGGDLTRWTRRCGRIDDHADAGRQHGVAVEEDQRLFIRISTVRPIATVDDPAAGEGRRTAAGTARNRTGVGSGRRRSPYVLPHNLLGNPVRVHSEHLVRNLVDPEGEIEVVDQVGPDDLGFQARQHPGHHPRRAADEAPLDRDHLLRPAHQVPLARVLRERAA